MLRYITTIVRMGSFGGNPSRRVSFQRVFVANSPLRGGGQNLHRPLVVGTSPRGDLETLNTPRLGRRSLAVEINALPLNVVARVLATSLEHRSVHPTPPLPRPLSLGEPPVCEAKKAREGESERERETPTKHPFSCLSLELSCTPSRKTFPN